tara:strand:+ start:229 stop:666 length:438 start_codon:yes stop_codon:yes gene_type:complete
LKRKKHLQSAFSLIELLVVVAIIGILSSVGVISYSGYISSTKMKSAENIMSQIMLAQTEYYSDHGSYFTQAKAKCAPDSDSTTEIVSTLNVPVSADVDFNFCIHVHDTINYSIVSLWSGAGNKYKDCEISMNNVNNKPGRTSSCN